MIKIDTSNINQTFLDSYYNHIHERIRKRFIAKYKDLYLSGELPCEEEIDKLLGFFNIKELSIIINKKTDEKINIETTTENLNVKFQELIIGKIDSIDYYENLFNSFNFNKECKKIIKDLMDYDDIFKTEDKSLWGKQLNLKVCPYCNRQYTFTYKTKKDKKEYRTYQLDHFYNKNKYYYLSCSFFNLVPSCSNCNLRKHDKEGDFIYPYSEEFGEDGVFTYNIDDISVFYGSKDLSGLYIDFNISQNNINNKINSNIELFNLLEVYNEHKDIVIDIIVKKLIYNEGYINSLFNDFEIGDKNDLLSKLFFEYTAEDLTRVPFSKLHNDIIRLMKNN